MSCKRTELTNIILAAVQDRLVCSAVLTDMCERIDDPQSQLLSLLLLVDRNVLDVPDGAQAPQELALHKHSTDSDDNIS